MEKELKEECVRFILGDDLPGDGRFVKFCAGILVAEYPPAFSKAVDGNNLVLFALFASINGWLMTIRSNVSVVRFIRAIAVCRWRSPLTNTTWTWVAH